MKKEKQPEFVLSEQEKEFLRLYREHPELRETVNILLNVAYEKDTEQELNETCIQKPKRFGF